MSDDTDKMLKDYSVINKACRKDAENKEEVNGGKNGEIDCPLCGEKRRYLIATSHNNHLHSSYSTKGCLGFMQ